MELGGIGLGEALFVGLLDEDMPTNSACINICKQEQLIQIYKKKGS